MGNAERDGQENALAGAVWVVLVGAALGIAYNTLGLRSEPAFGLAWIATDKAADVFVLPAEDPADPAAAPGEQADGSVPSNTTDDPLAAMMAQSVPAAGAADLPDIPVLPRPIQMQLPVVKRFFDARAALFIDAREEDEYAAGHIPGAIHLAFDEAVTDPALLESLPVEGRPTIVYCGGGACEVSINLAWELIGVGHTRVTYFQGGFPEWTENGYPVETGAEVP